MVNNRQRIPQAVWFGLMLGLPVPASAFRDHGHRDAAGRDTGDSVGAAKDAGVPSRSPHNGAESQINQINT